MHDSHKVRLFYDTFFRLILVSLCFIANVICVTPYLAVYRFLVEVPLTLICGLSVVYIINMLLAWSVPVL